MDQIVLYTNVLVAAMRSRQGASYRLLSLLGDGRWRPNVTVAVVLEYESVLKLNVSNWVLAEQRWMMLLTRSAPRPDCIACIFYGGRWHPILMDYLILEAAIASRSDFIITFNQRHFSNSLRFGIRCLTPQEFLILLQELA